MLTVSQSQEWQSAAMAVARILKREGADLRINGHVPDWVSLPANMDAVVVREIKEYPDEFGAEVNRAGLAISSERARAWRDVCDL